MNWVSAEVVTTPNLSKRIVVIENFLQIAKVRFSVSTFSICLFLFTHHSQIVSFHHKMSKKKDSIIETYVYSFRNCWNIIILQVYLQYMLVSLQLL
jgi:amino acid permease